MVVLATMLLYATTLTPGVQAVDFKLDTPALAAVPASQAPVSAPTGDGGSEGEAPGLLVRPRFQMAVGFGHDVPLSFAVRQVIPAHLKVAFGDGVDRSVLVSWKGGRPWNEVLRAAVNPLGLHVTLSPGIVRISN